MQCSPSWTFGKLAAALAAMAQGDQEFQGFVNNWLQISKTKGELDQFYDKWILGKSEQKKQPRWSVIRDVLRWVD